jgi:hypothetical protein
MFRYFYTLCRAIFCCVTCSCVPLLPDVLSFVPCFAQVLGLRRRLLLVVVAGVIVEK